MLGPCATWNQGGAAAKTEGEMTTDETRSGLLDLPAPWPAPAETVRRAWIDANGHMNVAYYVLVFDHATDALLDVLDVGQAYRVDAGQAFFVAEAHVTYEREVAAGEDLQVFSQILGFDGTRLVLFHEMRKGGTPDIAATNEVLCLNVDLKTRRTAPLAEAKAGRLRGAAAAHAHLPRPRRAGRAISLATRRPA